MIELIDKNRLVMEPGPFDVHTHPRVTDELMMYGDALDGKAGLSPYTQSMLKAGFTGGLIMPNETMRLPLGLDLVETVPYPISTKDKLMAVQKTVTKEAYIPIGCYFGLDPKMIYGEDLKSAPNFDVLDGHFADIEEKAMGLKIYGGETEGGYNVRPMDIPKIAERWYVASPEKPIVMHLEDEDVGRVLSSLEAQAYGRDIPVHIAHVSSRVELEAVMQAKKRGMNVTCEVTPHHLFLDESAREQIGGYGCMKPTLKTPEDIAFIWANIDQVDMFASDCAPHREQDKEAASPTYGVTNHSSFMPLLLGAVEDGRLSLDELYKKVCVNPRRRFNIPLDVDASSVIFDISHASSTTATGHEELVDPGFGHNPFPRLESLGEQFKLRGRVLSAVAGYSEVRAGGISMFSTNALHLITPQIIENVRNTRIG